MCERVKCVLLGDESVGKTSLVNRYVNDRFHEYNETTIGASFNAKPIIIGGKKYKIDIWDTAGQERYRSMVPLYYRQSNIVLICVDLSRVFIMEGFKYWYNKLQDIEKPTDRIVYLVGTKSDIKLNNVDEDIKAIKKEYENVHYIETSSKLNINIDELFKNGVNYFINNFSDQSGGDKIDILTKKEDHKNCCVIT